MSIDELDTWKEYYVIRSEEEKAREHGVKPASTPKSIGSGSKKNFNEARRLPESEPHITEVKPNPGERVVAFYGGVGKQ